MATAAVTLDDINPAASRAIREALRRARGGPVEVYRRPWDGGWAWRKGREARPLDLRGVQSWPWQHCSDDVVVRVHPDGAVEVSRCDWMQEYLEDNIFCPADQE